jgi:hypothetical protein
VKGRTSLLVISLLLTTLFSNDCKNNKPDSTTWRTDKQGIESRLPFLTSIEHCWWVSGVAKDGSRGSIPAPSSLSIRGYVKLTAEETSRLANAYEWTSIAANTFQPIRPPAEYDIPPMSGGLLVSEQLMRSLVASTTFRNGQIVLSPEQKMLYFDLAQD